MEKIKITNRKEFEQFLFDTEYVDELPIAYAEQYEMGLETDTPANMLHEVTLTSMVFDIIGSFEEYDFQISEEEMVEEIEPRIT